MEKIRGFERISNEQLAKDLSIHPKEWDDSIEIPKRSTSKSACYDLKAVGNYNVEPGDVVKIPTGLKVYMPDNEVLLIFIRSSLASKHGITLVNNVGVIDADYYNNEDNEGHFWIVVRNDSDKTFEVNNGDRIAQAMFTEYKITDTDDAQGTRAGGFGSTGK